MNWGKISTGWESSDAFQKKGVPQALANLRTSTNKSKEYRFKKKISEKVKSVFSVKSVFKFLSITAGVWTLYYHRYNFPCCRCAPSLRQGHKSKKETRITPRSTDWSFTDNFLIIFHQWYLDFDLDLAGFASVRALPFGVWYGDVIDRMLSYAFRKRECPSTHKSTKIQNISLK